MTQCPQVCPSDGTDKWKPPDNLEDLPLQEVPQVEGYDVIVGGVAVKPEGRFFYFQGLRSQNIVAGKCPGICPDKEKTGQDQETQGANKCKPPDNLEDLPLQDVPQIQGYDVILGGIQVRPEGRLFYFQGMRSQDIKPKSDCAAVAK